MSGHRLVLWFRNDLRLTDNALVHQAAQLIKKEQATEVSISLSRVILLWLIPLLPSLTWHLV